LPSSCFAREQAGLAPRNVRAGLAARVKDPGRVSAASQRLVEAGYGLEMVKTFPPTQVILLDEKRDYEVKRDERMKLLSVPLWQIDLPTGGNEPERDENGLFADFLPRIIKLRRTQGKLQQQIACLRLVEAIRLYAACHDGKPPSSLAEIAVPLPDDPVTGKPFVYTVDGPTADIRGRSLEYDVKDPECNVHYEVTLRK
jgi:hypothetical protein